MSPQSTIRGELVTGVVHGWGCFLAGLALAASAWAQFSPGPLSEAHSSLAGPARCTECHALGAGRRQFKCLSCHVEIRRRLGNHRGLHATLVKDGRNQNECAKCHSEHNGEGFVPTRWDLGRGEFDHSQAGYRLEGGHARVTCEACHVPQHMAEGERRSIRLKDPRRSYLGLSKDCLSCHKDEHRGQLSLSCDRCHTFVAWRPAARFDHARARFQLTGAHAKVLCRKCHRRADAPVKYTGIEFACRACHNDPHRAAFSSPCQSCHTSGAWKPVTMAAARFDHTKTAFPLLGKHAGLSCAKCHSTANYKQPVAHERCLDCHKSDPRRGQFVARADGGECAACHKAQSWRVSTYLPARHGETRDPVIGRHAGAECAKRQRPSGAATVYRMRIDEGTACHDDVHSDEFQVAGAVDCARRHDELKRRPARFDHYKAAKFPLAGAQPKAVCASRHIGGRYAGTPADRYSWHTKLTAEVRYGAVFKDSPEVWWLPRQALMSRRRHAGTGATRTVPPTSQGPRP